VGVDDNRNLSRGPHGLRRETCAVCDETQRNGPELYHGLDGSLRLNDQAAGSGVQLGKKRDLLEHWLTMEIMPRFAGRFVVVDEQIADMAGKMVGAKHLEGHQAGGVGCADRRYGEGAGAADRDVGS